ncbi:hypothetical protein PF005_g29818 [Phytophthora fragariae]|uniref:RxLR effector protein n=1 Tax=Phytophthora fragariae TaxID=53985 RepID=A0A6A3DGY5_9STRA|nr:hypothetical protein PF003_g24638 [Phytophthora fragariae]KAE8919526.1 hypothetical protein PF009_g30170 [Phytophthora fragariae]KAE9063213.1 hypothetical protein PF007_g29626 [Phytophthora fragariae]KAE9069617.1 hypothetical protein PF006_g29536 [Phytophthora fragariae]KAE9164937.1 hypothetical protein PF005_g29818 [Phytophthora fragariae]
MGRYRVLQMHFLAILVLTTGFLSSVGADFTVKASTGGDRSLPVSRRLRTNDDNERGIISNIPGMEKLRNLFKPSPENAQIRTWLKSGKSSNGVFVDLLSHSKVDDVLANPNFKTWARFVAKADKQNPDRAMIAILTARYEEKELAAMLQATKSVKGTKKIASKLQKAQFKMWWDKKIRPGAVIGDIFGAGPGTSRGTSARDVWRAYKKFLKDNKLSFGYKV